MRQIGQFFFGVHQVVVMCSSFLGVVLLLLIPVVCHTVAALSTVFLGFFQEVYKRERLQFTKLAHLVGSGPICSSLIEPHAALLTSFSTPASSSR